MSFTTRCPACGTLFRVVPDQLKIADGWVRCGHCADVFDATLYMEAETAMAPHAVDLANRVAETRLPTGRRAQVAGQGAGLSHTVTPTKADSESLTKPGPTARELPAAPHAPDVQDSADGNFHARGMPGVPSQTGADDGLQEPEADFQTDLQRFAVKASDAVDERGASVRSAVSPTHREGKRTRPKVPPASPDAGQGVDLSDPEPGFVRQARRRAFWQTPGMRVLLSCFALLLALALLLQWALHERDTLAAWQPRLAPVLTQLCAPLGCEVAPVRRIDAIVIDSSALVRRLGNFYSFDLVLKNTAPLALAVPALELSLTDARDEVIARRVFLPEQLPGAPALLPAQNSVSISLRLSLTVGEATPMAGYRALVFYP